MADYNFVETDSAKLYTAIIGNLMDYCDEPLYPGDERRIFGEALVAVLVSLYNEFNDKMKQRTLQNARGYVLDAIGDMFYRVERSAPAQAHAMFRFSVGEALAENIIIPAGTRITTDGSVYFATQETAVLQAGDTYVDLLGVCTTGGSDYNGFTAGTIGNLVDLIPYIASAQNITISTGGDDGEPYTEEGDNRFRERISLSYAKLSTAGPESAYRYFALSADPDIIDVSIDVPSANVVDIYALMKDGKLPDEDALEKIEAAVSKDDVRPMTDTVTAKVPSTVAYTVNLKYYTTKTNEAATIQLIEAAGGAIDQYNEWQQSALHRNVNPDKLRELILAPLAANGLTGAFRMDITGPTYTAVGKNEVARLSGSVTVSHEVIG